MMKQMKRLAAVAACLCVLVCLSGATAQSVALSAEMGYNGVVTYLRTLPIRIHLTNQGADAAGTLSVDVDRDETNYDRYTLPLTLAAGAEMDAVIPVSLSTKQSGYTIRWVVNGETESR